MMAVLGNFKTLIIGKKIQLGITEQVAGTSPKIVSDVCVCWATVTARDCRVLCGKWVREGLLVRTDNSVTTFSAWQKAKSMESSMRCCSYTGIPNPKMKICWTCSKVCYCSVPNVDPITYDF